MLVRPDKVSLSGERVGYISQIKSDADADKGNGLLANEKETK
jgi:hypothetical protein